VIKKITESMDGMETINITHKNIKIDEKNIINVGLHQKNLFNY